MSSINALSKSQFWNRCQFAIGSQSKLKKGHYESYFLRANHPDKPEAFWVRYTIFSPKNYVEKAVGELWAIYFNGETDELVALKKEVPMSDCQFSSTGLNVRIGEALLEPGHLLGEIKDKKNDLGWHLNYASTNDENSTLLFLPEALYEKGLPKAKSIVGCPNVLYQGCFTVNGREINIDNWRGSENHNWGSKHTDEYAWGQVAGFDNDADAFLECITARIKIGPFWSPKLSIVVLRMDGKEYRFNSIKTAFKAQGLYKFFDWNIKTSNGFEKLAMHIHAPHKHFVGLTYNNPPGGTHTCLNTKIAHCSVLFTDSAGRSHTLVTKNRAAFEILTDAVDHGVSLAV